MKATRRDFIRGGVSAFTLTFAAPAYISEIARAQGASRRNLVICGTHGKTTTTALTAFLLRAAGRDPGFLIGGVPLREPVVQYGPFVMNTKAEIQEAFDDFEAGRLGRVPAGALQPHRPRR